MNQFITLTKDCIMILMSMLLYIIFLLNWQLEMVRSTSTRVNYLLMILVLMIPLYCLFRVVRKTEGLKRIFTFAVFGTFSVFSVIATLSILLNVVSILVNGVDPGFEYIKGYRIGKYKISAYRTNTGATTDFGVYLRQERHVGLGLLRVKRLDHIYPANNVEIEILDGPAIRCEFLPDSGLPRAFLYDIDTDL